MLYYLSAIIQYVGRITIIIIIIIIIIHVIAKLAGAVASIRHHEHDEPRASPFFDSWSGRLFVGSPG